MTESDKLSERERMAARLAKFMESETPERVAERKRFGARCGHIKRKLKNGGALEGELLEIAVDVAGGHSQIVDKLRAGQLLDDYELYLMLDVFLLHARLA
jgi:hypothetical protein